MWDPRNAAAHRSKIVFRIHKPACLCIHETRDSTFSIKLAIAKTEHFTSQNRISRTTNITKHAYRENEHHEKRISRTTNIMFFIWMHCNIAYFNLILGTLEISMRNKWFEYQFLFEYHVFWDKKIPFQYRWYSKNFCCHLKIQHSNSFRVRWLFRYFVLGLHQKDKNYFH